MGKWPSLLMYWTNWGQLGNCTFILNTSSLGNQPLLFSFYFIFWFLFILLEDILSFYWAWYFGSFIFFLLHDFPLKSKYSFKGGISCMSFFQIFILCWCGLSEFEMPKEEDSLVNIRSWSCLLFTDCCCIVWGNDKDSHSQLLAGQSGSIVCKAS